MPFVKDLDVALRTYVPAYETIGKPISEQITLSNINTIREATGLDWEPFVEDQYRVKTLSKKGELPKIESYEKVPGHKYITRGEGGPVLGSVKGTYQRFGNDELFGVAETLGAAAVDMRREVRCLAGGEVDGGRSVFLLFDLGVTEIKGDNSPHVRYMTLLAGHSGGGAVKVLGTNMRWKCTNALRAAEIEAAREAAAFSFRHTSRLQTRMANAQKAIMAALFQHEAIEEESARLLARRVKPAAVSTYLGKYALAQVIGKADKTREDEAKASPQRAHAVTVIEREITNIWESPTCDGIRDSQYGAFAAVIEYLDNRRPAKSPGTRFERTMVNTERNKKIAYQLLGTM